MAGINTSIHLIMLVLIIMSFAPYACPIILIVDYEIFTAIGFILTNNLLKETQITKGISNVKFDF